MRFSKNKLSKRLKACVALTVLTSVAATSVARAHQGGNPDRLTPKAQKNLLKSLKPQSYPTGPIQQPPYATDPSGNGPTGKAKKKQGTTGNLFERTLAAIADAIVPSAQAAVPAGSQVDLKVLVIATDGNEPSYAAITSFLDMASVPYDTLLAANDSTLLTSGCNLVAKLYVGATASACAPTTHAAYQAVILTTSTLVYCTTSSCQYAFGYPAWTALAAYEKQFGVREANLYTIPGGWRPNCLTDPTCPSDTLGLVAATGPNGLSYQDTTATPITNATLSSVGQTVFPYIKAANPLTISNAWTYFAAPVDSTTKALLTVPNGAGVSILASAYANPDGREVMALTMDHNPNLIHSVALGYGVINWVTKGVFLGERQVSMLAQPDDLLIPDDRWDTTCPSISTLNTQGYLNPPYAAAPSGYSLSQPGCTPSDLAYAATAPSEYPNLDPKITSAIMSWYSAKGIDPTTVQYRMTGQDLQNVVNWQNGVRGTATGAAFRLEFPFNGYGTSAFANDTLTPAVKTNKNQFNWISHTYDHAYLNPTAPYPNPVSTGVFSAAISTSTILSEWNQNDTIARNTLQLTNYYKDSVVHPSISGLDYYNSMLALGPTKFNAKFSVTDTSVPDEQGVYPNTGWWNYTASNANSMLEIPRYPLNLYYNVTTPDEWVSEYNYFYGPGGSFASDFWNLGRNIAYNEILGHESDTWLLRLLKGDQNPIMAHQSNLRAFTWSGPADSTIGLTAGPNHTLLGDVINATLTKYNKIFNLPLLSPSLHNLGLQYQRRTDRFLNRSGITATYNQAAGSQTISISYTKPAATGSGTTSGVTNCDPGYRPLPGPGSDLRPLPCSNQNTAWTWYTATKSQNPNPATSVTVPLTGVTYGTSPLVYGGQTTSYVTLSSGATVNVSVPSAW
jgi:hypothetical protein